MAMINFQKSMQRTLVSSVAMRTFSRVSNYGYGAFSPFARYGMAQSLMPESIPQRQLPTGVVYRYRIFSSSSSSSVQDFQPASPPPGTHGTPVFDDIDFTVLHQPNDVTLPSRQRNADPEAVFVVTGASRGIGLQLVKSLLQRTQGKIVACCRSTSTSTTDPHPLLTMLEKYPTRLDVVRTLDLENQDSIESTGKYLRDKYTRVDMLCNVAGLLGDGGRTTPGPERSISKMDRAWLEKTMAVNVIGPVMFTKEVMPLMMMTQGKSRRQTSTKTMPSDLLQHPQQQERPVAVVVNLSARVGSISDNELGGWYSYRMSKSALNQATRTLALELKRRNAWAVALHPGTTDTDLSAPFQANVKEGTLFPVEFTVHKLLNIIDALQEKHSGGFFDWSGQSLSF